MPDWSARCRAHAGAFRVRACLFAPASDDGTGGSWPDRAILPEPVLQISMFSPLKQIVHTTGSCRLPGAMICREILKYTCNAPQCTLEWAGCVARRLALDL